MRSLAESALRMGGRLHCVDLFQDFDLRQLCTEAGFADANLRLANDYTEIENLIQDIPKDVPLVPLGGLEFDHAQLRRIAQERPVHRMDEATINELRNPNSFFGSLRLAGISVPDYLTATDETPPRSVFHHDHWFVKDMWSSGGQSVRRIGHRDLHQTQRCLKPSEYLQKEIEGTTVSATFVASPDCETQILGCSEQLSGAAELNASGYQFCGNIGPMILESNETTDLRRLIDFISQRWQIRGVFGIDFIRGQNSKVGHELIPIELNPRLTASHEIFDEHLPEQGRGHAVGRPLLALHCQCFQPITTSNAALPQDARVRARLIVYSNQRLTVRPEHVDQLKAKRRKLSDPVPDFWLSDLPGVGTRIEVGMPLCSINSAGDDRRQLGDTLRREVRKIDFLTSFADSESLADMAVFH